MTDHDRTFAQSTRAADAVASAARAAAFEHAASRLQQQNLASAFGITELEARDILTAEAHALSEAIREFKIQREGEFRRRREAEGK